MRSGSPAWQWRCNALNLQKVELIKLWSGQYISQAQVTSFSMMYLTMNNLIIVRQKAALVRVPGTLLPQQENMITHARSIRTDKKSLESLKIRSDFLSIHSAPSPSGELLLRKIHKQAEIGTKEHLNCSCKHGRWWSGRGVAASLLVHHAAWSKESASGIKKLLSFAYR